MVSSCTKLPAGVSVVCSGSVFNSSFLILSVKSGSKNVNSSKVFKSWAISSSTDNISISSSDCITEGSCSTGSSGFTSLKSVFPLSIISRSSNISINSSSGVLAGSFKSGSFTSSARGSWIISVSAISFSGKLSSTNSPESTSLCFSSNSVSYFSNFSIWSSSGSSPKLSLSISLTISFSVFNSSSLISPESISGKSNSSFTFSGSDSKGTSSAGV